MDAGSEHRGSGDCDVGCSPRPRGADRRPGRRTSQSPQSIGFAGFEKTLEATRAGRREHVGVSGDLRAAASEITEQVRLLDGLVRYRFGDDAELMTAWASARNVLGPFRSKAEPEADAPGVVKPAA